VGSALGLDDSNIYEKKELISTLILLKIIYHQHHIIKALFFMLIYRGKDFLKPMSE